MYSVFGEIRCGAEPDLHIYDNKKNIIQPFKNKRYTVAYDGVLYNEGEIREGLISDGYMFIFDVTEEVVAHAFDMWREKCLLRLDGDFSFAIWDMVKKELFFARDVFGVRPFFYLQGYRSFVLSSEIKAIIDSVDVTDEDYIFNNINELMAGHYGVFGGSGLKIHSFESEFMCEALDILYDVFLTTDAPICRLIKKERLGELIKEAEGGSLTASRTALYLIRLNYLMKKYNVSIL